MEPPHYICEAGPRRQWVLRRRARERAGRRREPPSRGIGDRRRMRFESLGYSFGEFAYLGADLRGADRQHRVFSPVPALAREDGFGQLVAGAGVLALQQRRRDEVDRQDALRLPRLALVIEKARQLRPAGGAAEEAWGKDRDEKRARCQGAVDPLLPLLTNLQVVDVLENLEVAIAGDDPDLLLQPFAQPADRPRCAVSSIRV